MPGPSCLVTILFLQLHWRFPLAGLITFLSLVTYSMHCNSCQLPDTERKIMQTSQESEYCFQYLTYVFYNLKSNKADVWLPTCCEPFEEQYMVCTSSTHCGARALTLSNLQLQDCQSYLMQDANAGWKDF